MRNILKNKIFWIIIISFVILVTAWIIFTKITHRNIWSAEPTPIDVEKEIASIEPYRKFANIKENIIFSKVNGIELKLDLYYPKNITKSNYPLIIYVHGGGWYSGDKTILDQLGSSTHAIKSGFAVASINYRLVPQVYSPIPIEDVGKAIAYLRQNATTYNLKTDKIGLMASSAGAQLAAMHVLQTTDDSQKVQAVVLIAPPADLTAQNWSKEMQKYINKFLNGQNADVASPVKNIPETTLPPFLLIQGDHDKVVPPDQADKLNHALRAKKIKSTYLKVINAGHDFNPTTGQDIKPSKTSLIEATTQFFQKNLK